MKKPSAAKLPKRTKASTCLSIAERAKLVNWQKVDEILARVPSDPPLPGDEL